MIKLVRMKFGGNDEAVEKYENNLVPTNYFCPIIFTPNLYQTLFSFEKCKEMCKIKLTS